MIEQMESEDEEIGAAQVDEDAGVPDDVFKNSIRAAIRDAIDYNEEVLAEDRELALDAYRGDETPGTRSAEGQSNVITRDVRDAIHHVMPSLLRIFAQGDKVVEYEPRNADDVAGALQATQAFKHDFDKQIGVLGLYTLFKDALIQKTGTIKVGYSEKICVEREKYTGLDATELGMLLSDKTVTVVGGIESREVAAPLSPELAMQIGAGQGEMLPPITVFDVTINRKSKDDSIVMSVIPPEERLVDRKAPSLERSRYWGHRTKLTVGDLVAMGYPLEDVEGLGTEDDPDNSSEGITRNPNKSDAEDIGPDPLSRLVEYVELYIRADRDGDGYAELVKVCVAGENYEILREEMVDDIYAAEFCPNPEPHILTGDSMAEDVIDVQEINTQLVRGMLDSLMQSIHPRTTIVEGRVNISDVLSGEIGAVIRQKEPGMVDHHITPFVGKDVLPVLGFIGEMRDSRVGASRASQGLDPDQLQSTTKEAVTASVTAAQAQVEMIARLFAAGGMTRLAKLYLKLSRKHSNKERMLKLTGGYTPVDPRTWASGMDVVVCTGLGRGTDQDRTAQLALIAQKQEQAIQVGGPDNPVCNIGQYVNTLRKMAELAGFPNVNDFYKDPSAPQQPQQPQGGQQGQEGGDGAAQAAQAIALAEVNKEKISSKTQLIIELMKDDRERDKMELEAFVKMQIESMKMGQQMQVEQFRQAAQQISEQRRMSQDMLGQFFTAQPQGDPNAAGPAAPPPAA